MTLEGHETAEVKAYFTQVTLWKLGGGTFTGDQVNLSSFLCFEQMLNCKEIIEGLAKVLKKHTGQ